MAPGCIAIVDKNKRKSAELLLLPGDGFSLPNLCRNKYNLRRIVQNSSKKQDRSLTLGISIFSGSKLVMDDIST